MHFIYTRNKMENNYALQKMYVINLDDKPKRLQQMREDFRGALPAGFQIVRWKANRQSEGWKGCILSHTEVLQYLKKHHPSDLYMILEDDCRLLDLRSVFKQRFPKYLDYLRAHKGEWSMFHTGGIYPIPNRIVCRDPFIIECDWIVCSQFIIHSNKSADLLIDYGTHPKKWKWSLDTYLSQQQRGKMWVPYPMFTVQHCEDSSIGANSYLKNIQKEFQEAIKIFDDFVQKQNEQQQ
jgi:hypothetical protein